MTEISAGMPATASDIASRDTGAQGAARFDAHAEAAAADEAAHAPSTPHRAAERAAILSDPPRTASAVAAVEQTAATLIRSAQQREDWRARNVATFEDFLAAGLQQVFAAPKLTLQAKLKILKQVMSDPAVGKSDVARLAGLTLAAIAELGGDGWELDRALMGSATVQALPPERLAQARRFPEDLAASAAQHRKVAEAHPKSAPPVDDPFALTMAMADAFVLRYGKTGPLPPAGGALDDAIGWSLGLPPNGGVQGLYAGESLEMIRRVSGGIERLSKTLGAAAMKDATLTALPLIIDPEGAGSPQQSVVWRVTLASGRDYIVDANGRVYDGVERFLADNHLPYGDLSLPDRGDVRLDYTGHVILETHAKTESDWHAAWRVGEPIVDTVVLVGGLFAEPLTDGAATPVVLWAGRALALIGAGEHAASLVDRYRHYQSLALNQETAPDYVGFIVSAIGERAAGRALKATRIVSQGLADPVKAMASAQRMGRIAFWSGAGAAGFSSANLMRQWPDLTTEQKWLAVALLSQSWLALGIGAKSMTAGQPRIRGRGNDLFSASWKVKGVPVSVTFRRTADGVEIVECEGDPSESMLNFWAAAQKVSGLEQPNITIAAKLMAAPTAAAAPGAAAGMVDEPPPNEGPPGRGHTAQDPERPPRQGSPPEGAREDQPARQPLAGADKPDRAPGAPERAGAPEDAPDQALPGEDIEKQFAAGNVSVEPMGRGWHISSLGPARFSLVLKIDDGRAIIESLTCGKEKLREVGGIIAKALVAAKLPRPRTIEVGQISIERTSLGGSLERVSNSTNTTIADELTAAIAEKLPGPAMPGEKELRIDPDVAATRRAGSNDLKPKQEGPLLPLTPPDSFRWLVPNWVAALEKTRFLDPEEDLPTYRVTPMRYPGAAAESPPQAPSMPPPTSPEVPEGPPEEQGAAAGDNDLGSQIAPENVWMKPKGPNHPNQWDIGSINPSFFEAVLEIDGDTAIIPTLRCRGEVSWSEVAEIIARALELAKLPQPQTIEIGAISLFGKDPVPVSHLDNTTIADRLTALIAAKLPGPGMPGLKALAIDPDVAAAWRAGSNDLKPKQEGPLLPLTPAKESIPQTQLSADEMERDAPTFRSTTIRYPSAAESPPAKAPPERPAAATAGKARDEPGAQLSELMAEAFGPQIGPPEGLFAAFGAWMREVQAGRWEIGGTIENQRFTVELEIRGDRAIIPLVDTRFGKAMEQLGPLIAEALEKAGLPQPRTIEIGAINLGDGRSLWRPTPIGWVRTNGRTPYRQISNLADTSAADALTAWIARSLRVPGTPTKKELSFDPSLLDSYTRIASDPQLLQLGEDGPLDLGWQAMAGIERATSPTFRVTTLSYPAAPATPQPPPKR